MNDLEGLARCYICSESREALLLCHTCFRGVCVRHVEKCKTCGEWYCKNCMPGHECRLQQKRLPAAAADGQTESGSGEPDDNPSD
jgi:hypothetical protein